MAFNAASIRALSILISADCAADAGACLARAGAAGTANSAAAMATGINFLDTTNSRRTFLSARTVAEAEAVFQGLEVVDQPCEAIIFR